MDVYNFNAQLFARFTWLYQRITPIGIVVPDQGSIVPEVNLKDANAGGIAANGEAFAIYHVPLTLTHAGLPTIIDLSGNTGYMSGAYSVYDDFGKLFKSTAIKGVLLSNLGIPNGDGTYTLAPGFNAILGNQAGTVANWAAPFIKPDGTYNPQGTMVAPPGGWCGFACPNQDLPVGTVALSPGCLLEIQYGGSPSSSAQIDCDLILIG